MNIRKIDPSMMLITPAVIGALGYITQCFDAEANFGFSSMAIILVLVTSWALERNQALLMAIFASVAWALGEHLSGTSPSLWYVPWVNNAIRTVVFLSVAALVGKARGKYDDEVNRAYIDDLTQLFNRRYLFEIVGRKIKALRETKQPMAMVYIDMDHFKVLNDTQGHDIGDKALRDAGKAMMQSVRKDDAVIRIGSDEFVIVLPKATEGAVTRIATTIQANVKAAMAKYAPVNPSIGVVWYSVPLDDVSEMLAHADEMMYSIKHKDTVKIHRVE